MTADLAIGLAILLTLVGIAVWIYKSGGDNVKKKVLEKKVKAQKAFKKAGEKWNAGGGMSGAVKRGMRRKR